jgi:hypothetical protein
MLALIDTIAPRLGGVRQAVPRRHLEQLHQAGKYSELIASIKRSMGIELRIILGKVKSGGPERAVAWVNLEDMPPYGTLAFRRHTVNLFIRKDYLLGTTLDQLVRIVSHELAHIVLDATGNPFKRDERAVEVTAMLLGFAEYFEAESTHIVQIVDAETVGEPDSVLGKIGHWITKNSSSRATRVTKRESRLGYLSDDEIREAVRLIRARR